MPVTTSPHPTSLSALCSERADSTFIQQKQKLKLFYDGKVNEASGKAYYLSMPIDLRSSTHRFLIILILIILIYFFLYYSYSYYILLSIFSYYIQLDFYPRHQVLPPQMASSPKLVVSRDASWTVNLIRLLQCRRVRCQSWLWTAHLGRTFLEVPGYSE